uniref:Uncharacterized protein n=1 Tax=Anopheles christyi TaxID=43041 RepID=A0A182JTG8_9DIPT
MNVELRDFEISDSETELLIEPATARANRLNGRSFRNRRQESFKLGSFLKKLNVIFQVSLFTLLLIAFRENSSLKNRNCCASPFRMSRSCF